MDLKSGYPFWAVRNGLRVAFPRLQRDERCDVAIVGAGITGALVARELAAAGLDVVVVEQREVAWGSTCASTALLQYELDTSLCDLAGVIGEPDAAAVYRACRDGIDELADICAGWRGVEFARQSSLYVAHRAGAVPALRAECALRARHGLRVRWLQGAELLEDHGVDAPGGILSRDAAVVDPYRLTCALLGALETRGGRVYDRTCVASIDDRARSIELRAASGHCVRARHVVLAAGYAGQAWLSRTVARNRSSYAYVTDRAPDHPPAKLRSMVLWETRRPYLYLRSTRDDRWMLGGADDAIDLPDRRDRRVPRKVRQLRRRAQRLLPGCDLAPAFSWAGTFAETGDGLPFFGAESDRHPRCLHALAYGGNGIVYSVLGAGILRACIERKKHPLLDLFAFSRLDR